MMRSIPTLLLALFLALGAGTATIGCGGSTTKVVRTEQVQNADGTTSTVTKTEEEGGGGPSCSGVLSCTVDGIGFVIALPFKIIGGLISIIF